MLKSETAIRYSLADQLADLEAVRHKEYQTIIGRRRDNGEPEGRDQDGVPDRLFGACLSGGGIRSASFCLGALQALDQYGLIKKLDYLSTVSGGGYAGSSLAASMGGRAEEFPFTSSRGKGEDVRDSPAVSHIRDSGRFLAPGGLPDWLTSVAIALRGLMVNALLSLALLLSVAIALIAFNPTVDDLGKSFVWDTLAFWLPGQVGGGGWKDSVRPYLDDPFLLTKISGLLLGLALVGWALRRSYIEVFDRFAIRRLFEPSSPWAIATRAILISFCLALLIEVQPKIVAFVVHVLDAQSTGRTGLLTAWGAIASIIGATAALRGLLASWIQKALGSPTFGARVRAALAKLAFLAAGLALPLLIYGVFLALVIGGVRGAYAAEDSALFSLLAGSAYLIPALLAAIYIFILSRSLVVQLRHSGVMERSNPLVAAVRSIWNAPNGRTYVFSAIGWLVLLTLALIATRADLYGPYGPALFDSNALPEWKVLATYLLVFIFVTLIGASFTENANGLHRLYRDRLKQAFQLHGKEGEATSLGLHELTGNAPYLLINGTLNVRRSGDRFANRSAGDETTRADPAKRGRNAEFFLFSRHFVGSNLTGYLDSKRFMEADPQLDLATATAISGAAVSSSMGRFNLGLLSPTLALLNLRLGFWMINPRYLQQQYQKKSGDNPVKDTRRWDEILRFYLLHEAFGLLRADSPKIYVTDGGHIENLGLYQLLRRRCKLIIVIDGEADAGMNFQAFSDAQRFARIDDGVRISIDWQPMRDGALKRQAQLAGREPAGPPADFKHFASGKITYENGDVGQIIYIKACATGDEPDYVLDYERRFPLFPHESTGDQFFSEEQMEAYRALGFHAMQRTLDEEFAETEDVKKDPQSMTSFKENLSIRGRSIDTPRSAS